MLDMLSSAALIRALDCWGGLKISAGWMRIGGGRRNTLIQVSPAMMGGLALGQSGGARHEAG